MGTEELGGGVGGTQLLGGRSKRSNGDRVQNQRTIGTTVTGCFVKDISLKDVSSTDVAKRSNQGQKGKKIEKLQIVQICCMTSDKAISAISTGIRSLYSKIQALKIGGAENGQKIEKFQIVQISSLASGKDMWSQQNFNIVKSCMKYQGEMGSILVDIATICLVILIIASFTV